MEQHGLTTRSEDAPKKQRRKTAAAAEIVGGLLEHADKVRRAVSPKIELKHKSKLGQFMTPAPVARFMAAMFPPSKLKACKLLDAGAGLGALTCAFLDRWRAGGFGFSRVETTAYEFDENLKVHLEATLAQYADPASLVSHVVHGDFILQTALAIVEDRAGRAYPEFCV